MGTIRTMVFCLSQYYSGHAFPKSTAIAAIPPMASIRQERVCTGKFVKGIQFLKKYILCDGEGAKGSQNIYTCKVCIFTLTLLLDERSIDLSGAREKEGHFHYKNFLRASK